MSFEVLGLLIDPRLAHLPHSVLFLSRMTSCTGWHSWVWNIFPQEGFCPAEVHMLLADLASEQESFEVALTDLRKAQTLLQPILKVATSGPTCLGIIPPACRCGGCRTE